MLSIAICDDLPDQSALIHAAVKDYFSRRSDQRPEISVYNNSLLFLEKLKTVGGFDILLLDICMPGISGTDVAWEIRAREDKSELIFLTTSDEFAVDAFALKAAHYLLKPFSQQQFDEAMERAMSRFNSCERKKLTLKPLGGGLQNVDVDDILFIESFGHTQNVYLKAGSTTESQRSLSRLREMLTEVSPGQFDSPCKGYLINHKLIRTIEAKRVIMQNGRELPVARGAFREFQDRHFAYMFSDRV